MKIPTRHSVMPWLVEYAGLLLNRFEVSRDGKTSFERSKEKPAKTLGLEFGESVLWKRRPVGGALAKLTCLWEDGIFLGIRGKLGEIIVADSKGVWKTRSVQRKRVEDRWNSSSADAVKFVPWRMSDDDPKVDGEKLEECGVGVRLSGWEEGEARNLVGDVLWPSALRPRPEA